jgi:hypothetical protein
MASRIPALPRDSHVQSHTAVHKNELCDSHAPLVARAIARGWTRPHTGLSRPAALFHGGDSLMSHCQPMYSVLVVVQG